MGYTNYFYRKELEHDKVKFEAFVSDVKKAFKQLPKSARKLAGGDGNGKPEINNNIVCFNGVGDLSHETMCIERVIQFSKDRLEQYRREEFEKSGEIFSFCKTARKPYDLAVQVALILYKKHFGSKVVIASDGDVPEWEDALELVEKLFDYKTTFGKLTGKKKS